jgi:hypothetical protein
MPFVSLPASASDRRALSAASSASTAFWRSPSALHFATKQSRRLDIPSANAYGLYLVHYDFVV